MFSGRQGGLCIKGNDNGLDYTRCMVYVYQQKHFHELCSRIHDCVNLSTRLRRGMKAGHRSTMTHEYKVLKRNFNQGKPSMGGMGEFLSL